MSNKFENYEETLDLQDDYVREQLETIYGKVRSWAKHNNLEIIELDEGLEVKLPYNHLLHVDPFKVYVTGTSNFKPEGKRIRRFEKEDLDIRSYHENENSENYNIIRSEPVRDAVATLDIGHGYGSLIIGRSQYSDYVTVCVYKDKEEYEKSWRDMSPHERKEKIENMASSHHRELLVEELSNAGIKIPGFTD